ncbi:MAG: hypothetical protein KDD51_10095 [Bdellovibrionales bacterium]|nr:hypothetical protein [Bdellovibrionales bacterium]
MKNIGSKAMWALGVAFLVSAGAFAQEFHWTTRALDGEWNSVDGKYEISDVDFQDEVATFYFERSRRLDHSWGHYGGRDRDRFRGRDGNRDGDRDRDRDWDRGDRNLGFGDATKCRGTGIFEPNSKTAYLIEVCETQWRARNSVATLTLSLNIDRDFHGGRVEMTGTRSENFAGRVIQTGVRLVKEGDREGGPRYHRGRPGFGGAPALPGAPAPVPVPVPEPTPQPGTGPQPGRPGSGPGRPGNGGGGNRPGRGEN